MSGLLPSPTESWDVSNAAVALLGEENAGATDRAYRVGLESDAMHKKERFPERLRALFGNGKC